MLSEYEAWNKLIGIFKDPKSKSRGSENFRYQHTKEVRPGVSETCELIDFGMCNFIRAFFFEDVIDNETLVKMLSRITKHKETTPFEYGAYMFSPNDTDGPAKRIALMEKWANEAKPKPTTTPHPVLITEHEAWKKLIAIFENDDYDDDDGPRYDWIEKSSGAKEYTCDYGMCEFIGAFLGEGIITKETEKAMKERIKAIPGWDGSGYVWFNNEEGRSNRITFMKKWAKETQPKLSIEDAWRKLIGIFEEAVANGRWRVGYIRPGVFVVDTVGMCGPIGQFLRKSTIDQETHNKMIGAIKGKMGLNLKPNHHYMFPSYEGLEVAKKRIAWMKTQLPQEPVVTSVQSVEQGIEQAKQNGLALDPAKGSTVNGDRIVTWNLPRSIKTLQQAIHATNVSKGFWEAGKQRNEGEMIALMHSELSEALEAIRDGNPPDKHCPQFSSVEIELADVIIRAMDFAEAKGWNLQESIEAKMAFNATRSHKHGRQF